MPNTLTCPYCGSEMIRRTNQHRKYTYWWGCANWPTCNVIAAEHPDGTLLSTPADKELRQLRRSVHKKLEEIWGSWRKMPRWKKKIMYSWMEEVTSTGHVGYMQTEELNKFLEQLNDKEQRNTWRDAIYRQIRNREEPGGRGWETKISGQDKA